MDRQQYLHTLRNQLDGLPFEEIDSIMFEYQSHFEDGLSDGKSETMIANELGDPVKVGREMKAMHHINYAEQNPSARNTMNAVFSVIGLSIFNIFVLLIPFIVIVALLFSFALMAFVFMISPIFLLLDLVINGFSAVNLFEISVTVLMSGIGMVLAVGVIKLSMLFERLLIRYIKYNIKFVKGGASS